MLGIIIGCSVGGVVLLIIIIAVIYKCNKGSDNKVEVDQNSTKRKKENKKKDESFYDIKVENYDWRPIK